MTELKIELPADIRAEIAHRTGGDLAAEAAWVADAVRERSASAAQLDCVEMRAARESRDIQSCLGQGTRK